MIQTTIRIPVELHKRLKELAKKKGLTVNALIVQALWKTLKFKKHSNGWSIKRKKRGHADYQPFIRWYKNERALRIWYHTFYTRDFQF